MLIKIDDLNDGKVIELMEEHLADMYATSPPESVHALDIEALKSPGITFFSARENELLAGCVALKELSKTKLELKSMRTSHSFRNKEVASKLLTFVINLAKEKKYKIISLETGTQSYFDPARNLYKKFGLQDCEPFSNYQLNPNSHLMNLKL